MLLVGVIVVEGFDAHFASVFGQVPEYRIEEQVLLDIRISQVCDFLGMDGTVPNMVSEGMFVDELTVTDAAVGEFCLFDFPREEDVVYLFELVHGRLIAFTFPGVASSAVVDDTLSEFEGNTGQLDTEEVFDVLSIE